jgi:hypothetical protein
MLKKIPLEIAMLAVFSQIILLNACGRGPQPVILERKIDSRIYEDPAGGPDAGFQVRYRMKNNGSAGNVKIKVRLFTSEGSADRERIVAFAAQEVQQISFDFNEFSWTADDAKAYEQIEALGN